MQLKVLNVKEGLSSIWLWPGRRGGGAIHDYQRTPDTDDKRLHELIWQSGKIIRKNETRLILLRQLRLWKKSWQQICGSKKIKKKVISEVFIFILWIFFFTAIIIHTRTICIMFWISYVMKRENVAKRHGEPEVNTLLRCHKRKRSYF